LFAFCIIASSSYVTLEIYARLRPEQGQVFFAKCRNWIDVNPDQVDQIAIFGSLILGYWLIGDSIYSMLT
jgi:hypothetical protein